MESAARCKLKTQLMNNEKAVQSNNLIQVHRQEKISQAFIVACGIGAALLPFLMAAFLLVKGSGTFWEFHHSVFEFLFSPVWSPSDSMEGGGQVGAAMFIAGSLVTCLLSLVFALPVSLTAAIYMSEMATPAQQRFLRPIVELFTGIPSVIYGWIGLTVLVPFLRHIFPMPFGFSVLAASLVLAVMIFPVITTMAADAMLAVPKTWRDASYGLGATRWETIRQVILPAAHRGIFTGIVLGMARALGEALAVAMVIGQMKRFPTSLFMPASTMTTVIANDMGGAMEGGEYSAALWALALLLFLLSFLLIFMIHNMRLGSSPAKEA